MVTNTHDSEKNIVLELSVSELLGSTGFKKQADDFMLRMISSIFFFFPQIKSKYFLIVEGLFHQRLK